MYHYCFECRLDIFEKDNPRFIVEGYEDDRDKCVLIHNTLVEASNIVVCGSLIEEE